MVITKSFKLRLIASFIFAFLLNLHSSFAMEEKDETLQRSLSQTSINKDDVPEEIFGENQTKHTPLSFPIEQEEPLFLRGSNDVDIYIIEQLCNMKWALEGFRSLALTCKKGYELTHDKLFWKPLKKAYFGHLPEEYFEILIKGKKELSYPLAWSLLHQHLALQSEEIEQLKKILAKGYEPPSMLGDECTRSPVSSLDPKFKENLLTPLNNHKEAKIASERYFATEKILDDINITLIKECLELIEPEVGIMGNGTGINQNFSELIIDLKGAVTRLPPDGVKLIVDKAFFTDNAIIHVSLMCNHLRWLPDDLFKIKRMKILDLRNNHLTYVPCSIKHVKEDLKELALGNFKPLGDKDASGDAVGRRTTGNSFEEIPPVILSLTRLTGLNIDSVGLKKFSENEVYQALPKLSFISINHNDLKVVPSAQFGTRRISVRSYGNPTGALDYLLTEKGWEYCLRTYISGPFARLVWL